MKKDTKTKPKSKQLVKRKAQPVYQPSQYVPPPPPPRYQYDPAPALDPQTRHVLVNLEQQVKTFANLEGRVTDLVIQVRRLEKETANVPETWWHQLQVSISALQREFKDRVPALERQYANMEFVMDRMQRLEDRMENVVAHLEKTRSLLREQLLDRGEESRIDESL